MIGASLEHHWLEHHWSIIGASLKHHWSIIGTSLEHHWSIFRTSLEHHWSIIGALSKSHENWRRYLGVVVYLLTYNPIFSIFWFDNEVKFKINKIFIF